MTVCKHKFICVFVDLINIVKLTAKKKTQAEILFKIETCFGSFNATRVKDYEFSVKGPGCK